MAKTMTPSAEPKRMTDGQITKAVASYRALLEKHVAEFDSASVQTVLGQPELVSEQLEVFRRRVEAISNMVVCRVKVNRARTPQEALDATGRTQYTDRQVVDSMLCGEGEEVEMYFFKLNRYVSDDELAKEYELRGLKPDPIAQMAVNEADSAFADQKPNGMHWKDAQGEWCFVAFDEWDDGERGVACHRGDGGDWSGSWWFGGVRK